MLDVVRGRAADGGVAVELAPVEGLSPVTCDPEGVHRALLNVVGNAVDAVADRDGARVVVAVGAEGGFAEITVTDNGPGIPADKLADVFKPFVSTKGSRGTGLGLAVSRKILREHGGDILVESTEGKGSRFTLRLPLRSPLVADMGRTLGDIPVIPPEPD